MEAFMDDFSMYSATYDQCLNNLSKILQRREDVNLVLNLEKCHFIVQEGVVLGHVSSKNGIEAHKAKVEVIEKWPPLTSLKGVRSFLRHVSFYRQFIKDFSKTEKPLTQLLVKDMPFEFNKECLSAFRMLKVALITAPVMQAPDSDLPFDVMCDATDFAIEDVLGQ